MQEHSSRGVQGWLSVENTTKARRNEVPGIMALIERPSTVVLRGKEIKEAIAALYGFDPAFIDTVRFLFRHPENDIGINLDHEDVIEIGFKPYSSIAGSPS